MYTYGIVISLFVEIQPDSTNIKNTLVISAINIGITVVVIDKLRRWQTAFKWFIAYFRQ